MTRMRLPVLILGGLLIGALVALLAVPGAMQRVLPAGGLKSVGQATIGGPFTLVDHNGRTVTDKDFQGRFMLVFFGFTYCPDVCPAALQLASAALDRLGPKAERVTPVFISVDPQRDTPAQLKSYLSSFHSRFVGLSGTPEQVGAVAKAYRVYYKVTNDPGSTAGYTVDHSSIIYLMGPDGKFLTHFTHATSVDAIVAGLSKQL